MDGLCDSESESEMELGALGMVSPIFNFFYSAIKVFPCKLSDSSEYKGGGKAIVIVKEAFLPLQNKLCYAHVGEVRDVGSVKSGIFAFVVQ